MTVWSEAIAINDDNEPDRSNKLEVQDIILARYQSDIVVRDRIQSFSRTAVGLVTVTMTQLTETFNEEDQILILQHNYRRHVVQQESSTDEIVRHMAQLMKLANSFFLFLDSIKCGDAIAIEHTMVEWLPRWRAVGKHRYVDLVLRMIETNYGRLSPYQLEELRWNRCVRMNEGRDMVAMDDVCEMLNDWTKEITKSQDINKLADKSVFISLLRRCARSVGAIGLTRCELRSSIPKQRIRERRAMYELFSRAKIWTESRRKLSDDFLWKHYEAVARRGASSPRRQNCDGE